MNTSPITSRPLRSPAYDLDQAIEEIALHLNWNEDRVREAARVLVGTEKPDGREEIINDPHAIAIVCHRRTVRVLRALLVVAMDHARVYLAAGEALARGSARVGAFGGYVHAAHYSQIELCNDARGKAIDGASVRALDASHVRALDRAVVRLEGYATAELRGETTTTATGHSHARAARNARVIVRDEAIAEITDEAVAEAFDRATIIQRGGGAFVFDDAAIIDQTGIFATVERALPALEDEPEAAPPGRRVAVQTIRKSPKAHKRARKARSAARRGGSR